MAHSVGHRSVAVFRRNQLPSQAQAKAVRRLTLSDLSAAQQAQAQGRDLVCIIDGDEQTILAPTGSLYPALKGVSEERELQGI